MKYVSLFLNLYHYEGEGMKEDVTYFFVTVFSIRYDGNIL